MLMELTQEQNNKMGEFLLAAIELGMEINDEPKTYAQEKYMKTLDVVVDIIVDVLGKKQFQGE